MLNIFLVFLVTVGCLILHQRYVRNFRRYSDFVNDITSDQEQSQSTPDAEMETEVEYATDNAVANVPPPTDPR